MGKRNANSRKYLGSVTTRVIRADDLDLIVWQPVNGETRITLHVREFTTLCPVTGQPDYGELHVHYVPAAAIVETKSFKLYLQSFRDVAGYNERLVEQIADDFVRVVKPHLVHVRGVFAHRGGISVEVNANRGYVHDPSDVKVARLELSRQAAQRSRRHKKASGR